MWGLALGAIGGYFFGPVGWFIGSTIGSYLDGEDTVEEHNGPRQTEFRGTNSKYGRAITRGWGTHRIDGNIIWASDVVESSTTEQECQEVGGIGGFLSHDQCVELKTYHYRQSFAVALCEGPVQDVNKIWADGKLIYSNNPTDDVVSELLDPEGETNSGTHRPPMMIYRGNSTQPPNGVIEQWSGVGNVPGYRNLCYVVFDKLNLEPFGFRLPNITAEVVFDGANLRPYTDASQMSQRVWLRPGHPEIGVTTQSGKIIQWDLTTFTPIREITPEHGLTGTSDYLAVSRDYIWVSGFAPGDPSRCALARVHLDSGAHNYVTTYPGMHSQCNSLPCEWKWDTYGPLYYGKVDTVRNVFHGAFFWGGLLSWPSEYTPLVFPPGGFSSTWRGTCVEVDSSTGAPWSLNYYNGTWNDAEYGNLGDLPSALVARKAGSGVSMFLYDLAGDPIRGAVWMFYVPDDHSLVIIAETNTAGNSGYKFDLTTETVTAETDLFVLTQMDSGVHRNGVVHGRYLYCSTDNGSAGLKMIDTVRFEVVDSWSPVEWDSSTITAAHFVPAINAWVVSQGISFGAHIYYLRSEVGTKLVGDILSDMVLQNHLLERYNLTAQDLDVSGITGECTGYVLHSSQTGRAAIKPLQQAFLFDVFESDGKIKGLDRPRAPQFTIPGNDLGAGSTGRREQKLTITRQKETSLPNDVSIIYTDKDLDYQQSTQYAHRVNTVAEAHVSVTLPMVLTATAAKQLAEALLSSTWEERESFEFSLPPKYAYIEPSDIVTLDLTTEQHTVRVAEVQMGANGMLQVTAARHVASSYASNAVADTGNYAAQAIQFVGSTRLEAAELPFILTDAERAPLDGRRSIQDSNFGVWAFAHGYRAEWAGAAVWSSQTDATGGAAVTEDLTSPGSVVGRAVNALGAPEAVNGFDRENVFTAELNAVPETQTMASILAVSHSGLLVVGSELIKYRDVTDNGDGTYTFSGLLRGVRGTQHHAPTHYPGERVLVISSGAFLPTAYISDPAIVWADPKESYLANYSTIVTQRGECKRQFAPYDFKLAVASDDLTVDWVRADRWGLWRPWLDVPLSNADGDGLGPNEVASYAPNFRVEVVAGDGVNIVNTYETGGVTGAMDSTFARFQWTYTAAAQTADFGGPVNAVTLAVEQRDNLWLDREDFGGRKAFFYVNKLGAAGLSTDWSNDAAGSPPGDWSERWDTGHSWDVNADSSAGTVSGKVLTLVAASADETALTWGLIGTIRGCDVRARIRVNHTLGGGASGDPLACGVLVRGSEPTAGQGTGLVAGFSAPSGGPTRLRIMYFTDLGNAVTLAEVDHPIQKGLFYDVHVEVVGRWVRYKVWPYYRAEPDKWHLTAPMDPTGETFRSGYPVQGWVGIANYSGYTIADVAFFAVGFNGNKAEL